MRQLTTAGVVVGVLLLGIEALSAAGTMPLLGTAGDVGGADVVLVRDGQPAFEHTQKTTGIPRRQLWIMPFAFEASEYLKARQIHNLAVRVYNQAAMGGVWRPVYILATQQDLASISAETIKILVEQELAGS